MMNGIPSKTDGFFIVVNGVDRSFRDQRQIAVDAGVFLKQRNPKDEVQVRVRANGDLITIQEDGRLG